MYILTRSIFSLTVLLFPLVSWANTLTNPLRVASIEQFLVALLDIVVLIAFPIIVLFLVFIGFRFIAAQGNPDELKKVREYFFWAIVGALIILGAQALSIALQGTVQQLSQGI